MAAMSWLAWCLRTIGLQQLPAVSENGITAGYCVLWVGAATVNAFMHSMAPFKALSSTYSGATVLATLQASFVTAVSWALIFGRVAAAPRLTSAAASNYLLPIVCACAMAAPVVPLVYNQTFSESEQPGRRPTEVEHTLSIIAPVVIYVSGMRIGTEEWHRLIMASLLILTAGRLMFLHATSLLLQESAPGPEFIPTLAAAVVAMARYSEEVFAQPLLSVPAASGVEPYLQPVAALAVITPCALGPLLGVFSFTSGPTPYMEFLAAKVPWSYILVSCCSMFVTRLLANVVLKRTSALTRHLIGVLTLSPAASLPAMLASSNVPAAALIGAPVAIFGTAAFLTLRYQQATGSLDADTATWPAGLFAKERDWMIDSRQSSRAARLGSPPRANGLANGAAVNGESHGDDADEVSVGVMRGGRVGISAFEEGAAGLPRKRSADGRQLPPLTSLEREQRIREQVLREQPPGRDTGIRDRSGLPPMVKARVRSMADVQSAEPSPPR